MVIRLANYPDIVAVENFSVFVVGSNNCAFDVITFDEIFDEETYRFSVPVNYATFDPVVRQTVAGCPRQCSFYENTEPLTMPSFYVDSVNDQSGAVTFGSGSTYLDGSVFCILIVCESLESEMAESQRIAFNRFTVEFQIDCTADEIQFVQDFTAVDYYITGDVLPQPVMPIFTQTFPSCPVSCGVTSPAFSYQTPGFVTNIDPITGAFLIIETNSQYIGNSIPTTISCVSLGSGFEATDTFDVVFKELPQTSGTNPCVGDSISFQSSIQDFTYTISYPANQLLVNVDYNQEILGCPVQCGLFLAGTTQQLPSPPFTAYGTSGIFTVFTSDASYDGNVYDIEVGCQSVMSTQSAIVESFTITFEHDDSASDSAIYSGCANDHIYWNSDLVNFDLPVSNNPPFVTYTPLIQQQVPGCPIQCIARSMLFPTAMPAYVLQFNSESGAVSFSYDNLVAVGQSDQFSLTCSSILSILSPDMKTIRDIATITFVDGTEVPTVLDDGTIIPVPDGGDGGFTGGTCADDKIAFLTDFTVVDYFITPSSGYQLLTPTILQYVPGCPIQCTLDESNSGQIISTSIFNVQSTDGRVSIRTKNPANARDVQMRLTCSSIQSTNSLGSTSDEFVVALQTPGSNCFMDILDFTTKIPQKIDYVVSSPAN